MKNFDFSGNSGKVVFDSVSALFPQDIKGLSALAVGIVAGTVFICGVHQDFNQEPFTQTIEQTQKAQKVEDAIASLNDSDKILLNHIVEIINNPHNNNTKQKAQLVEALVNYSESPVPSKSFIKSMEP